MEKAGRGLSLLLIYIAFHQRFISHDLGDKSKDDIDKMLAEEQATRKMRVADGSSAVIFFVLLNC